MRQIFIVNPAAGKRDRTQEVRQQAAQVFPDAEVLVSSGPGDCAALARAACQSGEEVRLYACGGDGTLNEVVNGAAGFSNAAVTHYPGGSGNDFIKCFSDPKAFFDLARFQQTEEKVLDLIQCGDKYSINICSMGYDARIGTQASRYKRLPLVTGTGAYLISAAVNTVRGIHRPYQVEVDGERFDGEKTLIWIANGRHYGGTFYPVPVAKLDDGWLDVLLVRGVGRMTVLKVIGSYAKGGFASAPDLITYRRAKRVHIVCREEEPINLDGELVMSRDASFQVVPGAIRFFYPRGLSCEPEDK